MSYPNDLVNHDVQPSLFPGGALSITLEALIDPQDQTVLFVVRGYSVVDDKLIALWSSAPVGFEDFARLARQGQVEWSSLLDEHTGPFDTF